METEAGVMPVQLPLAFHALKTKEKEIETTAVEHDIKGLMVTIIHQRLGE